MSNQEKDSLTNDLVLYSLKNRNGLSMTVTNFGGRIVSLLVPDKNGNPGDIVLGYDSLKDYLRENPYFGSLIGRYANRVAGGKFTLDGREYQLPRNNGPNTLHGGPIGYHNVYWNVRSVPSTTGESVELNYLSKDGEAGFPGNLSVKVTYTLTDMNELAIDYEATTDQATVVNLTDHSYFNLAGAGNGDILGHQVMINADRFCPVDETSIPTGELKPVKGTPFDFLKPRPIGSMINDNDDQLKIGKGYDHNFVLNKNSNELSLALRVSEATTGRVMELWTTDIGVQFYSGNFLDGTITGKGGKPYNYRSAICTETQHFPDSPNKPRFPSTVLKPGEVYKKKTVYKFLF
ncbi:MAG: aldose epimerase family protein [Bacteroidota bacterium]